MKKGLIAILLLVAVFSISAQSLTQSGIKRTVQQEDLTGPSEEDVAARLMANAQLALSTKNYPVTAGDVYTLAYAAGNTPVVYKILVDTTYRIRVANLAVIDVKGKNFTELKAEVEKIVTKNYPLSGVQFAISTPSSFNVILNGEVKKTAEQDAWALSRLSSVVTPHLTPFSSLRDILITSIDGDKKTYDLFKAQRLGDLSQDPLLRPGDVITVNRIARSVHIAGAVERPGTYQLLSGENLQTLITVYASGFTPVADREQIELLRYVDAKSDSGDKISLAFEDVTSDYVLHNYDSISIGLISDLIPVMFIEGAVSLSDDDNKTTKVIPEASTRLLIRFNYGENYAVLLRRHRTIFSAVSDTTNAYIIRDNKRIPINLNPILYDASYRSQYDVEKEDVLIIPFRQYFVTVSGAVVNPSRYPYIPDRDWSYYVALAGGFNSSLNSRQMVSIRDVAGKKHSKDDPITPEMVIEAHTNSFLFYFNQYAPIITTTLAVVTSFITVQTLLSR